LGKDIPHKKPHSGNCKKKECGIMPRGKELEQLPMANIAPGAGEDAGSYNREVLGGMVQKEQPQPAKIEKEK
jgi:hypothetical protein